MQELDQKRKELQEQLEQVKQRLEMLDMIDERLFEMKDLADMVINEELTWWQIRKINKRVRKLEQEVLLLEKENTTLS